MKTLAKVVLAIAMAAIALPAFAQAHINSPPTPVFNSHPSIGKLTIVNGSAMTSTGGPFATVSDGEDIESGEVLQLKDGDLAYIEYANGMVVQYNGPGTFNLQMPATTAQVGTAGGTSAGATAGIIIGTSLLTAALVDQNGDVIDPDNPLSR